jgi:PTH1 family peptidyl-tRNA hydrolase
MGVDPGPWLLVGLGNPGSQYAQHRHNVGFMVADAWLAACAPEVRYREKWQGQSAVSYLGAQRCVVLKPQTYMNRSGHSVQAAASYLGIFPPRIIVVHDELDFDFGRIAVKVGGGHGGHKGLADILMRLGSADFVRIRVGIGRPVHGEASAWVLSDFGAEERGLLGRVVDQAQQAVTAVIQEGPAQAMNRHNRVVFPGTEDP